MASGPTLPPQAYTREILTAAFNWLQSQPESVRKLATTPDALVGLYMRAQRYGNSTLETDAPVSSQSFMSDLKSLAEGLKQFESPHRSINYNTGYQAPTAHSHSAPHSTSTFVGNHQAANANAAAAIAAASAAASASAVASMAAATSQNQQQQQQQQMTQQLAAQMTSQMQTQIPLQTPQQIPNTALFRSGYAPAQTSSMNASPTTQQQLPLPMAPPVTQQTGQMSGQAAGASAGQMQMPQAYSAGSTPMPSLQAMQQQQMGGPAMNEMSLRMIHEVKNALNLSSDAEAINMMLALAYKNLKNLLS